MLASGTSLGMLALQTVTTSAAVPHVAGYYTQSTERRSHVETLLAVDRQFSAASAKTDPVTGCTAMFASDISMPVTVHKPDGTLTLMQPAFPEKTVAPTTNARFLFANAACLKQAKQNFSNEASRIGLGAAVAKAGADDAVNMGNGAGYTVGARAVAGIVSDPANPTGPGSPFFTICRRVSPSAPRRYVAE